MSAKTISNYNLASQSNYKLEIPGLLAFNYFLQSVTFPSLSMEGIENPYNNNQVIVPGNTVNYNSLSTIVLMDEDFEIYMQMVDWLKSFKDDADWKELIKDIRIHILNANKKTNLIFVFTGAFPTNLGDITLDSSQSDVSQITFNLEFRYQYMTYTKENL